MMLMTRFTNLNDSVNNSEIMWHVSFFVWFCM